MGSFYGSSGYVARKLGKKGLREFQDIGACQVAATFKQLGLDEPESVAMAIATTDKNLLEARWRWQKGTALWRSDDSAVARWGVPSLLHGWGEPDCQGALQDLH